MTEADEQLQNAEDFLKEIEDDEYVGPSAMVAPHELGGIKLVIRSREEDGAKMREVRIDIDEAAMLIAHLQALITMAFNTIYARQAQMAMAAAQNEKKIVLKR